MLTSGMERWKGVKGEDGWRGGTLQGMTGQAGKRKLGRGSATKPADAEYQRLCAYTVLFMRSAEGWEPLAGDGIDVEVKIGTGKVAVDIGLRSPDRKCILIGECKGWAKKNVSKSYLLALRAVTVDLKRAPRTQVEGLFFASSGFQSGLVRLAKGYRIRLAKVRRDQNPAAFTIAFAEYDPAKRKVVFRKAGVGITEQVNMSDGVRVELSSPDGRVIATSGS